MREVNLDWFKLFDNYLHLSGRYVKWELKMAPSAKIHKWFELNPAQFVLGSIAGLQESLLSWHGFQCTPHTLTA